MPNISKQRQQVSRIRLPPISKILENIKDFAVQNPWCIRPEYYNSNVPYPCRRDLMHDLTVYHLSSAKTSVNNGTHIPIGTVVNTVPCDNDAYRSYSSETEDDNRRISESSIDLLTTVAIQRLAEERESTTSTITTTTTDELVDVEPSNNTWSTVEAKSRADSSEPHASIIKHNSKTRASITPTQQRKCQQCGKTSTPEWRRGPVGPRTLCNACGLFYCKLVKKVGERTARERLLARSRVG